METKMVEIEVDRKLVEVEALRLPDLATWVVNGTLKDIEFEDGTLLRSCLDFGKTFKVTVVTNKKRDSEGVVFYSQEVYATMKQCEAAADVIAQLPDDCFVMVSRKSLRGIKHARMVCPERTGNRARTLFEVM